MAELLNPTTFLILTLLVVVSYILGLRIAKEPEFGLVLLLFFLPFERIPSFEIAGFTFKINHFIAAFTFVFLVLSTLFNRRKIAPNPLTWPLILLFSFFLLSGIGAEDSYRQLTVYISLLIMLVIYLTTVNTLTNQKILSYAITGLLLASGIMAIVGIYQFFGDLAGLPTSLTGLDPGYTKVVFGFPRVHAFSKEPLYYANYLFIPLGIGLALFFSNRQEGKKKFEQSLGLGERLQGPWLLPLLILLLVNFVLTLSRGAFLAFIPFLFIFGFFYFRQVFSVRNIILAILVIAVSLFAVYKILDSVSPDALDEFISHATLEDVLVKKQGESGFGRLQAFSQAIQAWETAPAFGIGLGNFGPFVKSYPLVKPDSGWDIVNNEYLELLAETGILGVLAFSLVLIILFGRSLMAYREATNSFVKAVLVGSTAALVGVMAQYLFFSTLYIIHVWVLFGLVIGTQNLILQPERLPSQPR